MESIPESLHVKNKDLFKSYNDIRIKNMINKEIYDLLVSRESENEYYDLDSFTVRHLDRNIKKMHDIMNIVIDELQKLGWTCKYSFNDTGLFIYSTEKPPPSCW